MHQSSAVGDDPASGSPSATLCRNDQRRNLGSIVRSVVRRIQRGGPAEVAGAVCGWPGPAVGLPHLRGAHRPDADPADARSRRFLPADQYGHHSSAGRHHRPRSLAGDAGPPPRPGGGEAACSDRQPVFGHRGVAGGAGGDRRQCDHRSRSRPAVFRPDPRGDPELADHCPRVYEGTRAAHPRRHSGNGQRHIPCAAIIRSGSQIVPRASDRERRLAQPAGRDADRQGHATFWRRRKPASSWPSRRRRRNSSTMSRKPNPRSRCSPKRTTSRP